jgi:hypothetical protein
MDNTQVRLKVDEIFEQVAGAFPEKLGTLIKEKTFIAGGCFKSMVLDEKVNDWDFWFKDKESVEEFKNLFKDLDFTKSSGLTNRDNLKIKKILVKTDNAFTLKFPKETIQFVFTNVGKPSEVVANFDFKHTQCFYDPVTGVVECNTYPMVVKELLYNAKTPTPLSSIKRAFKFVQQGWTLRDTELEKIVQGLVGVDWKQPEEVKKQTKGMYRDTPERPIRDYGRITVDPGEDEAPAQRRGYGIPDGFLTPVQAYAATTPIATTGLFTGTGGGVGAAIPTAIFPNPNF